MNQRTRIVVGMSAVVLAGSLLVAQKPAKPENPPAGPGNPTPMGVGTRGAPVVAGSGRGRAAARVSDTLSVSVTYTGKGAVDAAHEILVFLFATPALDATSQPLATMSVTKNGGTANFKGLTASPVYVTVVYNETGAYHGTDGAPPAGTPFLTVARDTKSPATPIKPGSPTVKVSFSDTKRWQ